MIRLQHAKGQDEEVRRTIVYVVAWLVAGAAAVALASAAVSMVGNQVTDNRPAPLSADEVRTELSGDSAGTRTSVVDTSSNSTVPAQGTTSTTTSSTGTRPGATATSIPSSATTTTARAAEAPEYRTYSLVGGTVTLRFASTGVTVQEATPKAGYAVELEPTHDNGVRVEFRSAEHRSRVEGWWDGGPRDEVDEDDEAD